MHEDGRRLQVRGEGGEVLEFVLNPATARFVAAGGAHGPRLELLARFRAASRAERAWVREVLREHCAEHFPDVSAP